MIVLETKQTLDAGEVHEFGFQFFGENTEALGVIVVFLKAFGVGRHLLF